VAGYLKTANSSISDEQIYISNLSFPQHKTKKYHSEVSVNTNRANRKPKIFAIKDTSVTAPGNKKELTRTSRDLKALFGGSELFIANRKRQQSTYNVQFCLSYLVGSCRTAVNRILLSS